MPQQLLDHQISVLLITHPGRIQDGLRALLRTIPQIGPIYQAADSSSAAGIIQQHHPALVLLDSKLIQNDMTDIACRIKTMSPETRCVLLVDNPHQPTKAQTTCADTILLSGFSAWNFLKKVENLLT